MQNILPKSIEEMFENKEFQYTYFSEDSLDNNWSMDWFIKAIGLSEFIILNEGTQIVLHHPNYNYDLQIDAGGLGDFYSHTFDVSVCNDLEGYPCCGKPTHLSSNGLVYECDTCGGWSYSSS